MDLALCPRNINNTPKIYTVKEVARILKCGEETVKNHLWRSRDLRYCKVGREARIREEDLKEFIEKRLVPCVLDEELLS